jgi:hypothetical protein
MQDAIASWHVGPRMLSCCRVAPIAVAYHPNKAVTCTSNYTQVGAIVARGQGRRMGCFRPSVMCWQRALQSTRCYICSPLPRLQRGFTTVAVARIDYLLHALYNRVACHYPTHSEVRTPIGYRAKAQSNPTPETMHQEKLPRALFSSLLSYFTYLPLPLSISRYLS